MGSFDCKEARNWRVLYINHITDVLQNLLKCLISLWIQHYLQIMSKTQTISKHQCIFHRS